MTDFPTEDVSMEDQAAGMHTGAIREGAARHPFRELSFFSNFTANNRSAPRSNSMLMSGWSVLKLSTKSENSRASPSYPNTQSSSKMQYDDDELDIEDMANKFRKLATMSKPP